MFPTAIGLVRDWTCRQSSGEAVCFRDSQVFLEVGDSDRAKLIDMERDPRLATIVEAIERVSDFAVSP